MDLDIFETNEEKSNEGVWCPIDAVTDIKIARYGNRIFQRALKRVMKPHKVMIDRGTLDDDTADKLLVEALAEGILIDWRGMTRKGAPLEYSRSAAVDVLTDKRLRDFREMVVMLSQDMQLFRDEEIDEAEKKPVSSSDGNASGESAKTSLEA